jgi:hypothetical protein
MAIYEYLLILSTIPLHIKLGGFFIPNSRGVAKLLISLTLNAGLAAVLMRVAPILVRPAYLVCLFFGAWLCSRNIYINRSTLLRDLLKARHWNLAIIASIAIAALLFRPLHHTLMLFESHQVMYFDALIEAFRADYWGNVKVSALFPSERAALHLTPAAFIGGLVAFFPRINLIQVCEARYILTSIVMGDFLFRCYEFYCALPGRKPGTVGYIISMVSIISSLVVFGNFVNYNILISSYLYIFLLTQIFLLAIAEKSTSREFLFFAVALLFSKAPILLTTIVFVVIITIPSIKVMKGQVFRFVEIYLLIPLVGANILSWRLIRQGIERVNAFFLIFPTGLDSFGGIATFPDVVTDLIGDPTLKFLYGIFFLGFGLFALIWTSWRAHRFRFNEMAIFNLLCLLTILFVRNEDGLTHQRHAFYIAGAVTAMTLGIAAISLAWVRILLVPLAIFYAVPSQQARYAIPFPHMNLSRWPDYHFQTSIQFLEALKILHPNVDGDFYIPHPSEPYWQVELYSSMLGLRVDRQLVVADYGTNRNFVIAPN